MDNLSIYLKSIANIAQYDDVQSAAKVKNILKEKDDIIKGNLKLVAKIAIEMANAWPNFDALDFIQEGNIALMRIIDFYDPLKSKFSTHVSFYVRGAIINYIKENTGAVRLNTTRNQRKVFHNLTAIRKQLENDGISIEQIAKNFGVDTHTLDVILGTSSPGDINSIVMDNPEVLYIKNEACEILLNKINKFRKTLDDKERKIFDDNIYTHKLSLQDIGCYFDITRQHTWRLKEDVLTKAKAFFTRDDLKSITE